MCNAGGVDLMQEIIKLLKNSDVSKKYTVEGNIIGFLLAREDGFCVPLSVNFLKSIGVYEDWWNYSCEDTEVDYDESKNVVYLREKEKVDIDTSDPIGVARKFDKCNNHFYAKFSGITLDNKVVLNRFVNKDISSE